MLGALSGIGGVGSAGQLVRARGLLSYGWAVGSCCGTEPANAVLAEAADDVADELDVILRRTDPHAQPYNLAGGCGTLPMTAGGCAIRFDALQSFASHQPLLGAEPYGQKRPVDPAGDTTAHAALPKSRRVGPAFHAAAQQQAAPGGGGGGGGVAGGGSGAPPPLFQSRGGPFPNGHGKNGPHRRAAGPAESTGQPAGFGMKARPGFAPERSNPHHHHHHHHHHHQHQPHYGNQHSHVHHGQPARPGHHLGHLGPQGSAGAAPQSAAWASHPFSNPAAADLGFASSHHPPAQHQPAASFSHSSRAEPPPTSANPYPPRAKGPPQDSSFPSSRNRRYLSDEEEEGNKNMGFVSAARQLELEEAKKGRSAKPYSARSERKTLGVKRFVPPFRRPPENNDGAPPAAGTGGGQAKKADEKKETDAMKELAEKLPAGLLNDDGTVPEKLKKVDVELLITVYNEILESSLVAWDDIAGLDHAKRAVYEAIIWPLQRPDLFSGIRRPTKGLLLFGPPGTGKTMIGKAIASESQSTFFNISASSLMSKWVGEGEKMVRALFAVASVKQPAVVFIDEIDSLLTARGDGEQDHTRRLKNEFLVQLDGAGSVASDRILIVGATNRPHELDEAARRRMEKRLYIPLPDEAARRVLVNRLLRGVPHSLSEVEVEQIVKKSSGYSGADVNNLCREAAFYPLREQGAFLQSVGSDEVRPVNLKDFARAFKTEKPTVKESDITQHVNFNAAFGSFTENVASADDDVEHFFDDV
ncbi:Fidgetin-like protein 1 [Diplonema papillatum]|nr:Fidgetin-like protein 1 [Diplonema papillatum]